MWIVIIGWVYVVGLMALTEKSVVAGIMTFLAYGVVPLSLIWYIFGRRKKKPPTPATPATPDDQ
jgi:membrane protein implicated in regulation of membrane protease activity